jgi:CHASE1-domain containing sensor protein
MASLVARSRRLSAVKPAGKHRVRRTLPWIGILVGGTSITLFVFLVLRGIEQQNAKAGFETVAQVRFDALETNITLTLNGLVSLGSLYDASHTVERVEFTRFTAKLLANNKAIQALEWTPRVTRRRRQGCEEAARNDGFPSFQITERLTQGRMRRAADRDEYFPVFFHRTPARQRESPGLRSGV